MYVWLQLKHVKSVVVPEVADHDPAGAARDLHHGGGLQVDRVDDLLVALAVDVGVHGVVGPQAQLLRPRSLVHAVLHVPGVHVALDISGQDPPTVHGDTSHLVHR